MGNQVTIVYYTSNREPEFFEQRIIGTILHSIGDNDIPIISVSQKPVNLGKNICVGDNIGFSDHNLARQFLIGVEEAKTPFIISAESDFLYPPEYFSFVPPEDGCWRNDNVWILYGDYSNKHKWRKSFRKKGFSDGAQICSRELLISNLTSKVSWMPKLWYDREDPEWLAANNGRIPYNVLYTALKPVRVFSSSIPCVSFKTRRGLRNKTSTLEEHSFVLPYWGDADSVRERYLNA